MSKNILIVDDEPGIRETLKDILELHSYEVTTVDSGERAIVLVTERDFDVILMDYKMHGIDGVETFYKVRETLPDIKVVFITAYYNEEAINNALIDGAIGVCNKPLNIPNLMKLLG